MVIVVLFTAGCTKKAKQQDNVTESPTPTTTVICTATPSPEVVTPTPAHTPMPSIWPETQEGRDAVEAKIAALFPYTFEYDDPLNVRPRSDFASDDEYIDFIQNECKKRFDANMAYINTHEIGTFYIMFQNTNTGSPYQEPVAFKIEDSVKVNLIKLFIIDDHVEKNENYRLDVDFKRDDFGFEGDVLLTVCAEIDGKITALVKTVGVQKGMNYFEKEAYPYQLPCMSKNGIEWRMLIDYFAYEFEQAVYEHYFSGEPIEQIIK